MILIALVIHCVYYVLKAGHVWTYTEVHGQKTPSQLVVLNYT